MKTRTIGLVAGMVLVAASAGFSQAAGMDKKADMNAALSSNAASGVPDILSELKNGSVYQAISSQEMKNTKGESLTIYKDGKMTFYSSRLFPRSRVVWYR